MKEKSILITRLPLSPFNPHSFQDSFQVSNDKYVTYITEETEKVRWIDPLRFTIPRTGPLGN